MQVEVDLFNYISLNDSPKSCGFIQIFFFFSLRFGLQILPNFWEHVPGEAKAKRIIPTLFQ